MLIKNYHTKLQLSQLFLHSLAVAGLYYYFEPLYFLLTLVGYYLFSSVGIELGLHRYFTHKTFKTTQAKENFLILLSVFAHNGSTLSWCANHRTHHRYSDQDGDPHPASEWFRTWFWLGTNKKNLISPTVVKDLLRNPWHKRSRDYYFLTYYTALAILSLINVKMVLYFLVLPAVIAFHATSSTNVLNHKWGYRNFDTNDTSTNNRLLNVIRLFSGSAWHNNHHANPGSYTTKVLPHEHDLVAVIIRKFFATELRQ